MQHLAEKLGGKRKATRKAKGHKTTGKRSGSKATRKVGGRRHRHTKRCKHRKSHKGRKSRRNHRGGSIWSQISGGVKTAFNTVTSDNQASGVKQVFGSLGNVAHPCKTNPSLCPK